jgi:N-acetylglucosaminyldiphosphoundecaprenol N-acetyl-beta-D-mannosaminyltransferase
VSDLRHADGDAETFLLMGIKLTPITFQSLFSSIAASVESGQGAYACAICATSIVESSRDSMFREALNNADFNFPDGAPVAWALGRIYGRPQRRMSGPSTMLEVLAHSESAGYRVLLYGSTPQVLALLENRIRAAFPKLDLAESISPPFRLPDESEDSRMCRRIRAQKPDVVLVALGAPKQEKWMFAHRDKLPCVMIGVGAAFEYNAGLIRRAPPWMQRCGLEWSHRLLQQPKRVGRRMATTLPVFAWRLPGEILRASARRRWRQGGSATRPSSIGRTRGDVR